MKSNPSRERSSYRFAFLALAFFFSILRSNAQWTTPDATALSLNISAYQNGYSTTPGNILEQATGSAN